MSVCVCVSQQDACSNMAPSRFQQSTICTDHPPPSTAEVWNKHSYTSTPPSCASTEILLLLLLLLTFRNPASYIKDGHIATFNTPHFFIFFQQIHVLNF
jgi:hypothetical protein